MKPGSRRPHSGSHSLPRCHTIAPEASALGQIPTSSCLGLPIPDPCRASLEPSRHVCWAKHFSSPCNKHISDYLDSLPSDFKCFGAFELTDVPCVCLWRQCLLGSGCVPSQAHGVRGSSLASFLFLLESRISGMNTC